MAQIPIKSSRRGFLKYGTFALAGSTALSCQSGSARAEPEVAWTFDGDSEQAALLTHNQTLYYADSSGSVFAFDPTTRGNKWTVEIGASHIRNGLAASGNHLATLGEGSTLTVLNAETGEEQWQRSVALEGRALTWSDGQLYTLSYADYSGEMVVQSYQSNGAPNWSTKLKLDEYDRVTNVTPGDIIVHDGRVICSGTRLFAALDKATGEIETKIEPSNYGKTRDKAVAAAGNIMFTTTALSPYDTTTKALAVDIATGNTLWTYEFASSDPGTVGGVAEEAVICGNLDTAYALEYESGQVRWQSGVGIAYRAVNINNGAIYGLGSVDNEAAIYKLNPDTGLEEWRQKLNAGYSDVRTGPPQVSQDHVFASVVTGNQATSSLYAVRSPNTSAQGTETAAPVQTANSASQTESITTPKEQSSATRQSGTQGPQTEEIEPTQAGTLQRDEDESAGGRGLFTNGEGENPTGIEVDSISMTTISAIMGSIGALAALAQMRGDN